MQFLAIGIPLAFSLALVYLLYTLMTKTNLWFMVQGRVYPSKSFITYQILLSFAVANLLGLGLYALPTVSPFWASVFVIAAIVPCYFGIGFLVNFCLGRTKEKSWL